LAFATVGNCALGDAPLTFAVGQSCNSVCTESGSELVCDTISLCTNTGIEAFAVTGYGNSAHDVSIWGECGAVGSGGTKFCCVFDEAATAIDTVSLKGTNNGDEGLSFTYDLGGANERNLQPWDEDPIDAFIQARGGGDVIDGSNYGGLDYDEQLHGGGSGDVIHGHDGGEHIICGDGDDEAYGDGGNDTLWGGDDYDYLDGGGGADKICDATGFDYQSPGSYGAYMLGGTGDDKLWYTQGSTWTTPLLHPSSDAGAQSVTDACGDDNLLNWPSEYPAGCDNFTITVEPTQCVGQN